MKELRRLSNKEKNPFKKLDKLCQRDLDKKKKYFKCKK